ncbi:Pectin lyase 2 [Colletotrichum chlorophyti]|uniref:pectin lyase n=1 Tax=Colletotrichum chlorophyti TaxID=708187 RepID=A0A1Q8S274_9PEZI|nr:Pectin lyase 2 [Colletotrichum chlorophyti]
MRSAIFSAILVALVPIASAADAVKGAAEGFAKGVTGGGNAKPVYPSTNAELVNYLKDNTPRVIVLTKTFDFRGTEGTATEVGCAPWGTSNKKCQLAINANKWCTDLNPNAPKVTVKYDKAGTNPMIVGSNKSIIGRGTAGVIKGKGLRLTGNAKNVIIQNIMVTDLNAQYVWGGDAFILDGCDLVWIDHVKVSLTGRQQIVLGDGPATRVTISNSEFDGQTPWSATCDNHHYWGMYFTGSNCQVTFKGNNVHHMSGRSPKIAGNARVHVVNNVFSDNSGHDFEIKGNTQVIAEGNIFQNVKAPAQNPVTGKFFTAPNSNSNAQASTTPIKTQRLSCKNYIGRSCQINAISGSGNLAHADLSALSGFKGQNVASCGTANDAKNLAAKAGVGRV